MKRVSLHKTAAEIDLLGPTIVCLIVNLVVIVIIAIASSYLPPQVPLLYGAPKGEEQLARQSFLMVPPIMVTAITILNTLLARFIKDRFLDRVIFGFTLVTTVLSTVTVVRILLLVGSFGV
jgi:hypothetical protein